MRSNAKTLSILATATLILLFASNPSAAHAYSENAVTASSSGQQPLSLSIQQGFITDAGPQQWTMSGGNLLFASVTRNGILGNSTWSSLTYLLDAKVTGLSASGRFYFNLHGTTKDGLNISLKVDASVVGAIPAICFPSYSTGSCAPGDTSEIPAFFLASGYVVVHIGSRTNENALVHLQIEDAALNPWGGPIIINSVRDRIVIVATYNQASTLWGGVKTAGTVSGVLGGVNPSASATPVTGGFAQKISAVENYVIGNETDLGKISLVGMSPSKLDSSGSFSGTSTIPTTGTIDCSPPGFPGTCTETGFSSLGSFNLSGEKGLTIQGRYNVTWPAPSVTFNGSISATVSN
jgi:hypothetical protein